MSKLPISVHILTWNSGHTLERALESVKECAEILVIDGGSSDETIAIAERFGARVVPQRFPGAQSQPLMNFGAARNIGLDHTTEPWILTLDSDERMSPESMADIREIVTRDPEPAAYFVPRMYVLDDGRIVRRASTYPNERIYFFHKNAVERWEKPVHERITLRTGIIPKHLKNGGLAPLAPLSVFRSKLTQYLKIEVAESRGKGWIHWLKRVAHTIRSRMIAILRLSWIWLRPGRETRLPLQYEIARFWYAWKLVVLTCPLR